MHIVLGGALLQLRQHTETQQHRPNDINGYRTLLTINDFKLGRQNPRVLNNGIQPVQRTDPLRESLDGTIVGQVDLPDLDARSGRAERGGDVGGRSLAFGDGADTQDDFGGVQADEVTRRLET